MKKLQKTIDKPEKIMYNEPNRKKRSPEDVL